MDLEAALKNWCDEHLVLGKCYGGNKDGPITMESNPNKDDKNYLEFVKQIETGKSISDIKNMEIFNNCPSDMINEMNNSYLKFKKTQERPGKLVYQDGTACSASYAFADIYLLDDGTYSVYSACGHAMFTGGGRDALDIKPQPCVNLAEVLDYLVCFCGHDPNTTGEMLLTIIPNYKLELNKDTTKFLFNKIKIPILSKCGNNKDLIGAICKCSLPIVQNN